MFNQIKKKVAYIKQVSLQLLLSFGYWFNFPIFSALAIKLSFFQNKNIKKTKGNKGSIIISYRTGGVNDIYQIFSKTASAKKILFLDRKYLNKIFFYFHKEKKIFHKRKFVFNDNYKNFIKKLIYWLNLFEKNFSFLTFNFYYIEDAVFREYAYKNGNKCFLLFKESFRTKAESRVHNERSLDAYLLFFNKIAVYNNDTKKYLTKRFKKISNIISVIGCPRALFSYELTKKIKITKVNNVLFYYFKKDKGIPAINNRFDYFKESKIKPHEPISWKPITNAVFETFIKLSKTYPHVNFFIKAKKGEGEDFNYIRKIKKLNLPNLKYFNDGPGHHFLVKSQIVIGMNSAAILESILAGKKVLIPFFSNFRQKPYNQYTFDLPNDLMIKNKLHLEKTLKKNIKKDNIRLPIINQAYNKINEKYFGDFRNSKKNLIKFLEYSK